MQCVTPELRCSYLTKSTSDELLSDLKKHGVEEYCPLATIVTKELVKKWHRLGFNVRAWGVTNTDVMETAYDAGVDGMTVNFPDKLTEYINNAKF